MIDLHPSFPTSDRQPDVVMTEKSETTAKDNWGVILLILPKNDPATLVTVHVDRLFSNVYQPYVTILMVIQVVDIVVYILLI